MASSPVLEVPPIELVPFDEKHLSEEYVAWLNDKSLMRYSENRHLQHSLESCQEYVESFSKNPHFLWAIEFVEANAIRHVGNITAHIDKNNGIADIGILLGDNAIQGKGVGFLAWNAVINYLRSRPDIRKITGGCVRSNVAMVKIMERSGMRLDGVRKDHYLVSGKPTDVLHMAVSVG